MKRPNPYRKFQALQDKIEDLEQKNERFKRVYSEYEIMSEELWNLETSEGESIPDDFINSIKVQTIFLEEEIEDWLFNARENQLK